MKNTYLILLFLFLASCTNQETNNEQIENKDTNKQIENEMENTFSGDNQNNSNKGNNKVEKLDATYKNPQTEVDMVINYSLDDDGTIKSISAQATTYDVNDFNEKIQYLVGKNIEEAEDVYISGSSLTSEAFVDSIKNR